MTGVALALREAHHNPTNNTMTHQHTYMYIHHAIRSTPSARAAPLGRARRCRKVWLPAACLEPARCSQPARRLFL